MNIISFFMPGGAAKNEHYNLFGLAQILWIVIPLILLLVTCFVLKNKKKEGRIVLLVLASVMLGLRIIKYFILKPFFWDEGWLQIIPFEMCTALSFIIPFTVFFKTDKFNTYVYPLAIIGGVVTLLYPEWIYNGNGLDFNKFESLIIHWLLIAIPYIKLSLGEFNFKFKEIYRPFVALIILCIFAEIGNSFITPGSNHNFLRSNPLPVQIPGIHHLFTLALLGVVLIVILYLPFIKRKQKL